MLTVVHFIDYASKPDVVDSLFRFQFVFIEEKA